MGTLYEGETVPATEARALTPDDSNDVADNLRALYVGVTGDIKVDMRGEVGTGVTFKNVPVGVFPIMIKRLYATGTDATEIIGLF